MLKHRASSRVSKFSSVLEVIVLSFFKLPLMVSDILCNDKVRHRPSANRFLTD